MPPQNAPTTRALPLPNDTYQGVRLTYNLGFESAFFEVGGFSRVAARARAAFWKALLIALVTSPFWLGFAAAGTENGDSPAGAAGVFGLLVIGGSWAYFFLKKDADGLASWHYLAEGLGGRAETAYVATLRELFNVRAIQAAGVTQEAPGPDAQGRWVMRISRGTYSMFVSIIPFGTDLHLGWTMTIERTGMDAIREWRQFFGKDWKAMELEGSSARALRDSVHHALNNAIWRAAESDVEMTLTELRSEWANSGHGFPTLGPPQMPLASPGVPAMPVAPQVPTPVAPTMPGPSTAADGSDAGSST